MGWIRNAAVAALCSSIILVSLNLGHLLDVDSVALFQERLLGPPPESLSHSADDGAASDDSKEEVQDDTTRLASSSMAVSTKDVKESVAPMLSKGKSEQRDTISDGTSIKFKVNKFRIARDKAIEQKADIERVKVKALEQKAASVKTKSDTQINNSSAASERVGVKLKTRFPEKSSTSSKQSSNRHAKSDKPIVWKEEPTESKPVLYQYIKNRPYTMPDFYDSEYGCRNFSTGLPGVNRSELPANNPFDFATYIKSNINIIFLGDSLAVEFGTWFQIAGQATHRESLAMLDWIKTEGLGLATAKVEGGGMVGFWRILGFMMQKFLGFPLPNGGFGWKKKWSEVLIEYNEKQGVPPRYDAMIYRVNHPWLRPENVSHHEMEVTIGVAKRRFGMDVVTIFQTAPINNNVVLGDFTVPAIMYGLQTSKLEDFREMNDRVRSFVASKNSSKVLLSDVEMYMDNVIEWNARQIGMSDDIESRMSHLEECNEGRTFRKHIVQICAEKVPHNSSDCIRNMLSSDGMHFCMSTLGPRLTANSACLIQCAYNNDAPQTVRECERSCNHDIFDLSKSMEDLAAIM